MEWPRCLELAILQVRVVGVCAGVGKAVVSKGQGVSSVRVGRSKNVSQLCVEAWLWKWFSRADSWSTEQFRDVWVETLRERLLCS